MSRTYRKKNQTRSRWCDLDWILSDNLWEEELKQVNINDIKKIEHTLFSDRHGQMYRVTFKENSKYGKPKVAKWYSDSGVNDFKDPGPSWFKNLFTIRPERRKAKQEIHKFMRNEEYEVQLHSKYYYEYWT